jgi:predicted component of type VI protein secretion system
MPAQLMALDDGPSILLDKPVLLLGRHPECDVQIESRKISRKHCVIAQVNDYLVVRDLDSTNGIRINGVRVTEGRLAPGDELTVGSFRFRLTWDTVPESPHHGRKPAKPVAPVSDLDDELLESCEEPVALGEPGQLVQELPLRPIAGRPVQGEGSLHLPDHIDLVPLSKPLPDSPSSHHAPSPPPPVEPV